MSTNYYFVEQEEMDRFKRVEADIPMVKDEVANILYGVIEKHQLSESKEDTVKDILSKIEYDLMDTDPDRIHICRVTSYNLYFYGNGMFASLDSMKNYFEENKETTVLINEYGEVFTSWGSFIEAVNIDRFDIENIHFKHSTEW